jgi:hypothetical protein
MQRKQCARFAEYRDRERNEELIGVLMAISIVSKRLAVRLMALEQRLAGNPRGGNRYVTGQSAANWQ